jgi:hypothetical protein
MVTTSHGADLLLVVEKDLDHNRRVRSDRLIGSCTFRYFMYVYRIL